MKKFLLAIIALMTLSLATEAAGPVVFRQRTFANTFVHTSPIVFRQRFVFPSQAFVAPQAFYAPQAFVAPQAFIAPQAFVAPQDYVAPQAFVAPLTCGSCGAAAFIAPRSHFIYRR